MVVRNAAASARRRGTVRAIGETLCAFGAIFAIEETLGTFTGTIRIRNANSIYGSLPALKAAVREVGRASVHWTFEEGEAVGLNFLFASGAVPLRVAGAQFRLES